MLIIWLGLGLHFFTVITTSGLKCKQDEFECFHPDDGCIPYETSCDGWKDCMRDGSDESPKECDDPETRHQPKGLKKYASPKYLQKYFQIGRIQLPIMIVHTSLDKSIWYNGTHTGLMYWRSGVKFPVYEYYFLCKLFKQFKWKVY